MIPVPDAALLLVDVANEPNLRYRRLLQNQYKAIAADSLAIERTARDLRMLVFTEDDKLSELERSVKARCCDLKLLEQVCGLYANV